MMRVFAGGAVRNTRIAVGLRKVDDWDEWASYDL